MAILGILLGITMTVLAWLVRTYLAQEKAFAAAVRNLADRVTILEKRKALLAEAVASQPKPAGVGNVKPSRWNEDLPLAEAKTR